MLEAIPVGVTDKTAYIKILTEKLDKMPVDVLSYINGAVDLAGMLDVTNKSGEQAS